MPRRRENGRRPGARNGERSGRGARGNRGEPRAKDGRPKKTQEELDAEMEDYWKGDSNGAIAAPVDDVDMIE